MHKWWQFKYYFVYIQISSTSLFLGNIFFSKFNSRTRLVGLISMKTKDYSNRRHLCIGSIQYIFLLVPLVAMFEKMKKENGFRNVVKANIMLKF